MPIQHVQNQYLIARGRAYFDPYDESGQLTGEIALGNCPDITLNITSEKWEHYSSEQALQEKDGGGVIRVDRTGSLSCDNFSPSNAALWLSGTNTLVAQANTPVTNEIRSVIPGRQYQLGATTANPLGVRNVSSATVMDAATNSVPYVAGTDYNVDLDTGRVQILETGSIGSENVAFNYTPVESVYNAVKSGGLAELTGALRVVSNNATGGNRDWFLPKVSLAPEGDLALIAEGTDPVVMTFALEVQKSANAEAIYCDGRPVAV